MTFLLWSRTRLAFLRARILAARWLVDTLAEYGFRCAPLRGWVKDAELGYILLRARISAEQACRLWERGR